MHGKQLAGAVTWLALLLAMPVPASASPGAAQQASTLAAQIKALKQEDTARDPKASIKRIQALLQQARTVRTIPAQDMAIARHALSGAYFYDQQVERALQELEGALADMRKAGLANTPVYIDMLADHGSMLADVGRSEEALKVLREVLAVRERTVGKEAFPYAQALFKIANIDFSNGRYVDAERGVAQAVQIARKAPDADARGVAIYWLSWPAILLELGETTRALAESQNAARWAEDKLGPRHLVTAAALRALGGSLNNAGRFAEAEQILRRALEMQQAISGRSAEDSYPLNSIGFALEMQGKPEEAEQLYMEAYRAVQTQSPRPHLPGEYLLNAANAVQAQGDAARSASLRRQALQLEEKAVGTSHPSYARAATNLAMSLMDAGELASVMPMLQAATTVMARERGIAHPQRVQADILQGIARWRSGDTTGYAQAERAIQAARQDLMAQVTNTTQNVSNARQQSGNFVEFARLALQANKPEAAFDALQLSQLGDLDIASAGVQARRDSLHAAVQPLVRQAQDAGKRLATLRTQRSTAIAAANPTEVAALETRIAAEQAVQDGLLARIDQAWPGYRQLLRPEPQPLAEVQRRLPSDEALLLAMPTRDGVLSMLVTRDRVAHAHAALPPAQVSRLVGRLRGSIDAALLAEDIAAAPFDVGAAAQLHAAVLPAALDHVARRYPRLAIIAGGELASVPMGVLITRPMPDDARLAGTQLRKLPWLLRRQAVATPVSLRMHDAAVARTRAPSALRFAGIGAPVLAKPDTRVGMAGDVSRVLRGGAITAESLRSLPALPDADAELQRMRAAFGGEGGLLVTGSAATEARLRSLDLSAFAIIAFATHGLVSGELRGVAEPGLVLTPASDDPADDGLLTASDVAQLRLDADWVILSACNTAAGEHAGAPLYSGLARAFVHAGARALLLSHWAVRDDVAARLSVQTVQAARQGVSRAQALRRAQLAVIDDRRIDGGAHPAVWAPFVVVGD